MNSQHTRFCLISCCRILLKVPILFVFSLCFADENPGEEELRPITEQEHITIVDVDTIDKVTPRTGTKIGGLDLFHSPMSLTIITRQQLQNSGARDLSEALELFVPGFQYMINKWTGTMWGLRGVASEINDKFVFLINGVKQNLQSRDGAISEVALGCLNDIDRVEVLCGPAGLSYGSGAIAGVVNIVTRRKSQALSENSLTLGTWDFNHNLIQFDKQYFLPLSKKSSFAFSFGIHASDGISRERGKLYGYPSYPYPDVSNSIPVYPKGGIPVTGSAGQTPGNYRLSFNYEYNTFRWYTRYTRQIQQSSGWFIYDPLPGKTAFDSTDTVITVDNTIIHESDPLFFFWKNTEGSGFNRRVYKVDNLSTSLSKNFPIDEDNLKISADFCGVSESILLERIPGYFDEEKELVNEMFGEKRLGLGLTYLLQRVTDFNCALGLELRDDMIGNDFFGGRNKYRGTDCQVISDANYFNGALFLEGYYDLFGREKVGVHFGLRYDYSYHFTDNKSIPLWSPKLSLIYTPNLQNAFKFIMQSSGNAGTADMYERNFYFSDKNNNAQEDDHFESPDIKPTESTDVLPGYESVYNQVIKNIKPERAVSYELASSHKVYDNDIYIGTSLSYNKLMNLLLWCQDLFRRINTQSYNSIHISLESCYAPPSKKIQIGLNHTYQRVVNTAVTDNRKFYRNKYNKSSDIFTWTDTETINGKLIYIPKKDSAIPVQDSLNGILSQITTDGEHFLNLAANITKLYVDFNPSARWGFHIDSRIFWAPLKGRKDSIENDTINKIAPGTHDYFNLDRGPLIKLNAGVRFTVFENRSIGPHKVLFNRIQFSLFVYDLLGIDYGKNPFFLRNTIRWQQMSWEQDRDLYSVDLFSLALRMDMDF